MQASAICKHFPDVRALQHVNKLANGKINRKKTKQHLYAYNAF